MPNNKCKVDAYMPKDLKREQLNWLAEEIRHHEHAIEKLEKSKRNHQMAIDRLEQSIRDIKELNI